jgi:alanine-glyoxylate transaminase / serine-glyoxylate transaminase / serine-pyruvate transaminase
MNVPAPLELTPRLLLGPGPSDAHPNVLRALGKPPLGHLDPQFMEAMAQVQAMLRAALGTANPLTLPISATGMAGMETCMVNLLEPGDKVVVCRAGFFGGRMVEVAERTGAAVTVLDRPWGQVFELDALRDVLQKVRPKVLSIVHIETSTGSWQPLEQVGALCREFGTLLLVDAVTSLGCVPLKVDEWGIDAAFSCSQKGLGCPPGLAPVSFGPRALEAIERRKTPVRSWYFDVSIIRKYLGADRVYHHTAPISMNYALHEGLRLLLDEGLEARWTRHLQNWRAVKAGLNAMGLSCTAAEGHQAPPITPVLIPTGIDDLAVRKRMLTEQSIEIGGGLGDFKGKVWRIGIMGYNSRPAVVLQLLEALEKSMLKEGAKLEIGAGVAAADKVYAAA